MAIMVIKRILAITILLTLAYVFIVSLSPSFSTEPLVRENLQPSQQAFYDKLMEQKLLLLPVHAGTLHDGTLIYKNKTGSYTDSVATDLSLSMQERAHTIFEGTVDAPLWIFWEETVDARIYYMALGFIALGILFGLFCALFAQNFMYSPSSQQRQKITLYLGAIIMIPILLTTLSTTMLPLLTLILSTLATTCLGYIGLKLWHVPHRAESQY